MKERFYPKNKRLAAKAAAVLLCLLTLLSPAVIVGNAITVEKDGNQYVFRSVTPTTGNINVLMIRVGFADIPYDDENIPADSEETLRSLFDGSEDSVNAYYEAASYGKLHLVCDEVFSYNARYERDYYSADSLIEETLGALESEIDFDKYDSDGDGILDVVSFDFAGELGEYATLWWPHVSGANGIEREFGGKRVGLYTFLRSDINGVFIHEFGHIFGADDYYSTADTNADPMNSYDIMSNNIGDHNGFTKWSYGWLGDDEIEFVDKNTGDTTVHLAPIETPLGDGKKLAVIAPELDRSNGFLDEFFVVEYDSGKGNNAFVFDEYDLEPGFRVFHVNAKSDYEVYDGRIDFIEDNTRVPGRLIHNLKHETDRSEFWQTGDAFFKEGDSITPTGYPNTGFAADEVHNGLFTGISITDFVTGDNPSFRVSFSDEYTPQAMAEFTLGYDELNDQMKMRLTSDLPVIMSERDTMDDDNSELPCLIDKDGNRFLLEVEPVAGSYNEFALSYSRSYPLIPPNTEFTLVVPEGFFKTGYNQNVPEFRQSVRSDDFLSFVTISRKKADLEKNYSNLFGMTDNTYGIIVLPSEENKKLRLTEYNMNGEEIYGFEFDPPKLGGDNAEIYLCRVIQLADGSLGLIFFTDSGCYCVKADVGGNYLSKAYLLTNDLLPDFIPDWSDVDFDLYKNGLCKLFASIDSTESYFLTIDFESEPKLTESKGVKYNFIDSESYLLRVVYNYEPGMYLYSTDGSEPVKIPVDGFYISAFAENGNVVVLNSMYDQRTSTQKVYADTYSKSGELLGRKDITDTAEGLGGYLDDVRVYATEHAYCLIQRGETSNIIIAYDKGWNYLGRFNLSRKIDLTYVGECALTKTVATIDEGFFDVVSRLVLGEYEVVPKRETPAEETTSAPAETAENTTEQQATVPAANNINAKSSTSDSAGSTSDNGAVQTGQSSPAAAVLALMVLLTVFVYFRYRSQITEKNN